MLIENEIPMATKKKTKIVNPMSEMTPKEIVSELDKHIIGQAEAKRAVAIALRNRWRRMQLGSPLRDEIMPKNILMIGPTGVGKTEIARRVAKLADAPFIKIEATKFTEVGYVGRDVESIIRDLADMAVKMMRERELIKVRTIPYLVETVEPSINGNKSRCTPSRDTSAPECSERLAILSTSSKNTMPFCSTLSKARDLIFSSSINFAASSSPNILRASLILILRIFLRSLERF